MDYPPKSYSLFNDNAPFRFRYPDYGKVVPDTSVNAEPYWYNIVFPVFDATIYLSYKKVSNNLDVYVEDSRILAYKHTPKAEAIDESIVVRKEVPLYGIIYDLKGNTASSLQFFLTDSIHNFLRGSLYFNTVPEKDSLAPIIQFLRQDLDTMIASFSWHDIPPGK